MVKRWILQELCLVRWDRIVNTASTIEFGQGGALYAKSVDNKNGGITLKRVAVGEKEHIKTK